jgi:hypothetical protein
VGVDGLELIVEPNKSEPNKSEPSEREPGERRLDAGSG